MQKPKCKSQKYGVGSLKKRGNAIIAIIVGVLALIFFAFAIIYYIFMKPFGVIKAAAELLFGGAASTETTFAATGKAFATAYCPSNSKLEGGINDQRGKPLQTLQQYLAGRAPYVSVALDDALHDQYPYGTALRIPEMDQKYNGNKPIEFRFVDNGGSFNGTWPHSLDGQKKARGLTAVDIATDCDFMRKQWSNLPVTLIFPAK